MIYANTPTSTLTKKQIKKIVKRSLGWLKSTLGENRRKQYDISSYVGDVPELDDAYGCYEPYENIIVVNLKNCKTVGRVTSTMIHEYVHSLQPIRTKYAKSIKEHGYWNCPFEVEARFIEKKLNRYLLSDLRGKS